MGLSSTNDMVFYVLHVGESMDGKTLFGHFVFELQVWLIDGLLLDLGDQDFILVLVVLLL